MLRKYGVGTDIYFPIIEAGTSDYLGFLSFAAGDIKILESGSWVSVDNSASIVDPSSGIYKLTLSAAEMSRVAVIVKVVDQSASKVFEDQLIEIETYGHASAQHAFDLDTPLANATIGTCTTNADMRGTNSAATESKQDIIDGIVDAIKAKTDGLNYTGTDVKATLDGEEVTTDSASRTASKADVSGLATLVGQTVIDGIVDDIKSYLVDSGRIDALLDIIAGYLDTEIAAIKAKTDNLPASPAAAGSEMALSSAAQTAIVAAVFAKTGITAGGTWTFAKMVKVSLAWATGNWRDKEGEAGTYEILDPDDESTVIMEFIPSATTPQKRITIL